MKKVLISVVLISIFTLLSSTTSQSTSLEIFSFNGSITESEADQIFPQVGDTFAGQFSFIYDPELKNPPGAGVGLYKPLTSFYFLFSDFTVQKNWGECNFSYLSDMEFWEIPHSTAFYIEDMILHFGGFGFSPPAYSAALPETVDFSLIDSGNFYMLAGRFDEEFGADIYGNFDVLNTSSIPIRSSPVPEPSTVILCGIGFFGLIGFTKRKKK